MKLHFLKAVDPFFLMLPSMSSNSAAHPGKEAEIVIQIMTIDNHIEGNEESKGSLS